MDVGKKKSRKRKSIKISKSELPAKFQSLPSSSKSCEVQNSIFSVLNELKYKFKTFEDGSFYIQDCFMQKFFTSYPEYLCIDTLCEIPMLDLYLVLFTAMDGNGHCEIISIALLKSGNKQIFSSICETFKKHNPYWKRIEIILWDQNYDQEIIAQIFQDKDIFISFYHCITNFKKDLSSLDPIVSNDDINRSLELFEKMMFITAELDYVELMKQMKELNINVFNLFKKRWHTKRGVWNLGQHINSKVFLKAFNSYFLSIRKKLKPVITIGETFENLIRNLHSMIHKFRKEWFQQISKLLHSPSASYLKAPVMQMYANLITPFASQLIYEHLCKLNGMNLEKIGNFLYFKINGIIATAHSCSCAFHKHIQLPCLHIFAIRRHLSQPLFIHSIRSSWMLGNYYETYFNLYTAHVIQENEESKAVEMSRRYEEYVRTSQELWHHIFTSNQHISQERLEIFQNLLKAWKMNFRITVNISEKQSDIASNNEIIENFPTDYFQEIYGISLNDIDVTNEFSDIDLCIEDNDEIF